MCRWIQVLAVANLLTLGAAAAGAVVVTGGPALAGLFHLCRRLVAEGPGVPVLPTFWHGFRQHFRRSVVVFVLLVAVAGAGYADLAALTRIPGSATLLGLVFISMLIGLALVMPVWVVLVAHAGGPAAVLHDAARLSVSRPGRALVLLTATAAWTGLLAVAPAVTLFFGVSAWALAVTWTVAPAGAAPPGLEPDGALVAAAGRLDR